MVSGGGGGFSRGDGCGSPAPARGSRRLTQTEAPTPIAKEPGRWAIRSARPGGFAVLLSGLVLSVAAANLPAVQSGGLRILFIGNSLTSANDLPSAVAALARAAGHPAPLSRAVARDGFSLEDHWNEGTALAEIDRGGWDVVVLQQGPSASPEGRMLLLRYAGRFSKEIRRTGARTALYMVWPSTNRRGDFPGVSDSYRIGAREVQGILLPAGDAWRLAWSHDPKLLLYSSDGLHPTAEGSYLAALVIYAGLYGETPIGAPAGLILGCGRSLVVPGSRVQLLRDSAAEAVKRETRH